MTGKKNKDTKSGKAGQEKIKKLKLDTKDVVELEPEDAAKVSGGLVLAGRGMTGSQGLPSCDTDCDTKPAGCVTGSSICYAGGAR